MHYNCQRIVLPIVSVVSHWYTSTYYYQCYYCNLSVAATLSRSLKTKEEVTTDERASCTDGNEDALDSFTDRLVQQKIIKWESFNNKTRMSSIAKEEPRPLEEEQVNEDIPNQNTKQITTHSYEIIKQFLHECHQMEIRPEKASLKCGMLLHAKHSDKTSEPTIHDISNLLNFVEYKKLASYDLYLADTMWRNGHFENALNLFWNMYAENMNIRKDIKCMLRAHFADAICKKGEAVLVLIINFSKKFVKQYNDYTLMSHVWEPCFLSKWHSDNQIASDLLEEYPDLKDIVRLRVHHITSMSLISHQIDVVQRLFEVLLKYDMKTQYELVLRSLFDYACSVRDFYACAAIVQSCNDLDVTLTDVQNARFLNLFCQGDDHRGAKLSIKTWPTKPSKFTFKF